MNDREAMICRLKELNYSNTYCALDTLIRIDEGLGLTMCSNCAFKDTELNLLACPYRSLIKEEIK